MAYKVRTQKGYWELRECVRDPITRKPRSRFLRYLGRRPDDPQARYEQMIATAERKGAEYDAWQKETYGETAQERKDRTEKERIFNQEKFLEKTTLVSSGPVVISEQASQLPDEVTSHHDTSESKDDHGVGQDASPGQKS